MRNNSTQWSARLIFPLRNNPDYLVYALEQTHAVKTGILPVDIQTELTLGGRDHMFGDCAVHGDLKQRTALHMPSLDDFDPQMNPRI